MDQRKQSYRFEVWRNHKRVTVEVHPMGGFNVLLQIRAKASLLTSRYMGSGVRVLDPSGNEVFRVPSSMKLPEPAPAPTPPKLASASLPLVPYINGVDLATEPDYGITMTVDDFMKGHTTDDNLGLGCGDQTPTVDFGGGGGDFGGGGASSDW